MIDAATETGVPGADGEPAPGVGAPNEPRWDACQLLTQPIAEAIVDIELEEDYRGIQGGWCRYALRKDDADALDVHVLLELPDIRDVKACQGDGCTPEERSGPYLCGDICEETEEEVPSLPDGKVVWFQISSRPDPSDPPGGLWVEWTAAGERWWLAFRDHRVPFREGYSPDTDFRMDTLARKDALIAAAEDINDMVLQGVGLE